VTKIEVSIDPSGLPHKKYSKVKNLDRVLPRTQIIERIQGRTNLPTDFGLWVDVLKSVDQRGIFGTQLFSQFVHFLKQRIEFLGVSRLISLLHLVTELGHLAIDSGLSLVAADYFENLLRVRLGHLRRGRLLSLRTYWRGGDHQNGNNQPQVKPPAMRMPNPKKSHKIRIRLRLRQHGGGRHVEHAFCVYVRVCCRSKLRRYSS
jgi:hypothetical protein